MIARFTLVLLLFLAAHAGADEAFAWKTDTPEAKGMSSAKLDAMRDVLARHSTTSLLIVRDGKIVYEWYARAGCRSQAGHSVAGQGDGGRQLPHVAHDDGRMKVDRSRVPNTSPHGAPIREVKITIREFATHSRASRMRSRTIFRTSATRMEGCVLEREPPIRSPSPVIRAG